jgi:hypothetical protein
LRAVPDAADKAFENAHTWQQHLVDDKPGCSTRDQRARVVVTAPAQRIKPSGQTKLGRSIVSEFREAITTQELFNAD